MISLTKDLIDVSGTYETALLQHEHVVHERLEHADVVAHENHARASAFPKPFEQFDDARRILAVGQQLLPDGVEAYDGASDIEIFKKKAEYNRSREFKNGKRY